MVEITLSALPKDDLVWKEECQLAMRSEEVLWRFDFGIDPVLEPLTDESLFQQRALGLLAFVKNVYPLFAKVSKGVVLASSALYRKIDARDAYEEELPGLQEPLRSHIKAMTLFADYLHRLASFLPDELGAIVRIDVSEANNLSDIAILLSKERFRHLHLEVSGWFPQKGTIGCVIPEDGLCEPETVQDLEELLQWLKEEEIPIRLVPQAILNEEWDGLDTLVMVARGVSAAGKRKAQGFVAAGGEIISYGGKTGIDGEILCEKGNRSRGIRTPDLLLPKQPR